MLGESGRHVSFALSSKDKKQVLKEAGMRAAETASTIKF